MKLNPVSYFNQSPIIYITLQNYYFFVLNWTSKQNTKTKNIVWILLIGLIDVSDVVVVLVDN